MRRVGLLILLSHSVMATDLQDCRISFTPSKGDISEAQEALLNAQSTLLLAELQSLKTLSFENLLRASEEIGNLRSAGMETTSHFEKLLRRPELSMHHIMNFENQVNPKAFETLQEIYLECAEILTLFENSFFAQKAPVLLALPGIQKRTLDAMVHSLEKQIKALQGPERKEILDLLSAHSEVDETFLQYLFFLEEQ